MDIGEFEKRMDDALGEVKHLLVQSGYYDNQTLENIDCNRDAPDDVQRWNELTNSSKPCWVRSRVEVDDDGNYYIVGHKGLNMDGLETRARK